jgi:hypothetical protein
VEFTREFRLGWERGGYEGLRVLSFQEKRKNQRKADWLFARKYSFVRAFLGKFILKATWDFFRR